MAGEDDAGFALFLERGRQELDGRARAEVRSADADADKHVDLFPQIFGRLGADGIEQRLGRFGGKVEPAEIVVARPAPRGEHFFRRPPALRCKRLSRFLK
jgi:hypothetical protein